MSLPEEECKVARGVLARRETGGKPKESLYLVRGDRLFCHSEARSAEESPVSWMLVIS
jgi:hypothetical protein